MIIPTKHSPRLSDLQRLYPKPTICRMVRKAASNYLRPHGLDHGYVICVCMCVCVSCLHRSEGTSEQNSLPTVDLDEDEASP